MVHSLPSVISRLITTSLVCVGVLALPLSAQPAGKATKSKAAAKTSAKSVAAPSLIGTWSGTATVPLPDSAIVVPVFYTFTQSAGTIGGTALVPGQGTGPISNVVREGDRIKFRVTAPEARLLEHDGKFAADGAIEGMVSLHNQPVAKFRVVMKPAAPPAK